jgi:dienelactone hydrolase
MRVCLLVAVLALGLAVWSKQPGLGEGMIDPVASEKGRIHFEPLGDQANVPQRYRLLSCDFSYELHLKHALPDIGQKVYHLQFPSPVVTSTPENNTVHADYYRPNGSGPFPGVIVLDITAGDQKVSRSISTNLAQNGIACLFVQMAYYGPRRPPGSKLRLVSANYGQSMAAVRQTVLDLRCAAAWLAARPEIDVERLGIVGTSLGSFIGALTAEMEPRIKRVVVLLGGGGLVDAYYDNPRAAHYRYLWELCGGTREKLKDLIAPADPLTCAANLRDRKVLIIAGKRDEIVPPAASLALWKATGEQKIVWYDCTHYGAVLFFLPAMQQLAAHLKAP